MILVVGASGQVGGAAVAELVELGASVRALVRSSESGSELAERDVELAVGDLGDIDSLATALRDVESVLLVSAVDPRQAELQGNLVAAARRSGVAHIVKLSGFATAVDSPVRSGRWHAETEAAIVDSGMAYTFLRPPYFLQNLLRFAPAVAEQGVLPSRTDPATTIAMVDSRDVAAVAARCLVDSRHRGCVYDVTGPEALTYGDIAQRLAALLGRRVERVRVPEHVGRENLLQQGPEWHADLMLEFDRAFAAGLGAKVTGVVQDVTGRPARDLDAFLREHRPHFGW